MRKSTIVHLLKIVKCLEESEGGWLWPTEIGKRCDMHRTTVVRLIDSSLSNFVEEESVGPTNLRMFRLKPGTEINSVMRFLAVKEKIAGAVKPKVKL